MKKRDQNLMISSLICSGIGLLVIFLLSLCLPLLLLRFEDPYSFLKIFVVLCIIVGGLVSSLASTKLNPNREISASMLSGAFMLAVLFILSLLVSGRINFVMLLVYIGIIASVSFLTPYFLMNFGHSRSKRMKNLLKRR